jgi:FdhE protein
MSNTGISANTDQASPNPEPFREIIDRFSLLLGRQAEVRATLPPIDLAGLVVEESAFLAGEPLIGFVNPEYFEPAFRESARGVWPVLGVIFPVLGGVLSSVTAKLESDRNWISLCLRGVAQGDSEALDQAAGQAGVAPDFLILSLLAAYGPCAAAVAPRLTPLAPMDLWRKSHCPVCGSDPDIAILENHPDPSEFLVSKGGQMWHHCPVCSHRWRFVRMCCAGCGNQDHKTLTRFSLPGSPQELIYACEKCGQYLPCIERAALNVVHLDAVAQSRGYTPVSPAVWTSLGFADSHARAS